MRTAGDEGRAPAVSPNRDDRRPCDLPRDLETDPSADGRGETLELRREIVRYRLGRRGIRSAASDERDLDLPRSARVPSAHTRTVTLRRPSAQNASMAVIGACCVTVGRCAMATRPVSAQCIVNAKCTSTRQVTSVWAGESRPIRP